MAITTHDLVVVVPGIMGSRLEDDRGNPLWDMSPTTYLDIWATGRPFDALSLTDDEKAGRYGRVRATRLIQVPGWLPFLRGVEPYGELVKAIRRVVHPSALLFFPYDWRLPVGYNAELLANRAMDELGRWHRTEDHDEARRRHPTGRKAQLVIVAHSMGGLLARHAALVPGVAENIRAVVTLGTPFHGSINAVTIRALTDSDVIALGGDSALFHAARAAYVQRASGILPGHRLVPGVAQQTKQAVRIQYSVAEALDEAISVDAQGRLHYEPGWGDGTVPTSSATLRGSQPVYFAAQHGSLAHIAESVRFVVEVVGERDPDLLGPPLGADGVGLGLKVPDVPVTAGEKWLAEVTGISSVTEAVCRVYDAHNSPIDLVRLSRHDGYVAPVTLPEPGLYRIVLDGAGSTPVSQIVFALG